MEKSTHVKFSNFCLLCIYLLAPLFSWAQWVPIPDLGIARVPISGVSDKYAISFNAGTGLKGNDFILTAGDEGFIPGNLFLRAGNGEWEIGRECLN